MHFYSKCTSTPLESIGLFSAALSSSSVIKQRQIFVVICIIVMAMIFDRRVFMATINKGHI